MDMLRFRQLLRDAFRQEIREPATIEKSIAECEVSFEEHGDEIPSCLLALFFPRGNVPHMIITRRSMRLRTSPGKLVLPGGKRDPGEDDITAALREGNEEVRAVVSRNEVVGSLPAFFRSLGKRRFRIATVVALSFRPQNFVANIDEVDELIEIPVLHWLRDKRSQSAMFPVLHSGEALSAGNAFALEYLRQLILQV